MILGVCRLAAAVSSEVCCCTAFTALPRGNLCSVPLSEEAELCVVVGLLTAGLQSVKRGVARLLNAEALMVQWES